jgi:hypothetical protein
VTEGNGAVGLYKMTISFLLGFVISGGTVFMATQKDTITRREFNEQNERYEKHLEANDRQIGELIHALQQTNSDVTRITEDLRISAHPVPPR